MRRKPIHQDLQTKVNDCLELLVAESIEAEVDQTISPDPSSSKLNQRRERNYKALLRANLQRISASPELKDAIKKRVEKEAVLRAPR